MSVIKKSDMFLLSNSKYFPDEVLPQMKDILDTMDEPRFNALSMQTYRDPLLMLLISLVGGMMGIDRFLLGQTGLGILKLVTCGGLGIWAVIDWFLIMSTTRDYNLDKARPILT